MALPTLSPEQRQAALEKAREARAARSALLAGLKAGTVTLADVLGRDDDIARRTSVAQVVRALPGVGPARAAAAMKRAGIILDRRVGGLGARQREQLLAEFPAGEPPTALMPSPLPQGRGSRERYLRAISQQAIARSPGCHRPPVAPSLLRPAGRLQGHQKAR